MELKYFRGGGGGDGVKTFQGGGNGVKIFQGGNGVKGAAQRCE